jgi:hypothetical protein
MLITKILNKIVYFGLSSIELVKLKFYKKIINIFTLFIFDFIFLMFLCFMFLFLGIGFSILIGNYFDNEYIGFIIMGLIFGIFALAFLFFFKKNTQNFIKSRICKYLI